MEFFGLKTCDSCRKALTALTNAGHAPKVIDIRADGVPPARLTEWLAGIGVDTLVNRRSTTWRGLSDEARAQAETATGAAALLAEHPTLMKRPVIVADGKVHVGWGPETQAAFR